MSLLMDALRRAETKVASTPTDSASTPVAEPQPTVPASSDLQLEPLDAPFPADCAPPDSPAPEAPDDASVAADQDAQTVDDILTQVQAQQAIKSMPGRPSSARKQAALVIAGFAAAGFALTAYYLWKSEQMITPQVPYSATLVTGPDPQVASTVADKLDTSVVEVATQTVQPDIAAPSFDSEQELTTRDPLPPAAVAAESPAVTAAEEPQYRIEIHKRRTPRAVPLQLKQAYQAYQRRDYQEAEQLYRQALRRYPANRDAMLGLAAIALHGGNRSVARYYYTQVLKTDPGDKTALLALQSLNGEHKQLEYGSRIKHWLQSDRNNAPLHFALGNQQAANGRWKEAQQAYFQAHRLQPDNADYAFNLAVSLDQLGLRQQALDYYLKAQELAQSSTAQFSSGRVDRRIAQLRKQAEQDS